MIINHNIAALNTHRQMGSAQSAQMDSMEKLSSGMRINKAADDAAGLTISEKMRGQIRGLEQGSRNAQDGISMIQTAEGALGVTNDILQRMRELTIQGSNDTNDTVDRDAIKTELDQLSEEVARIAGDTEFNGKKLINGSLGVQKGLTTNADTTTGVDILNIQGMKANTSYTLTVAANKITATDGAGNAQVIDAGGTTYSGTLNFDKLGFSLETKNLTVGDLASKIVATGAQADINLQIGSNQNQKLGFQINDMSAIGLDVEKSDLQIDSYANAQTTLANIDIAINKVSAERSKLGAVQNRLDHTINNINTSSENLTAAESRVRDVDYTEAA